MHKKKQELEQLEYLIQLGQRIVELREQRGINQRELADRCNWDEANLRKIEKGRANPSVKTLLIIAQALNVEMSVLFEGIKTPTNQK